MNGNQSTSAASYVLQEQMEADDSHLDPRIYKELEKLNKASEEINCLEVELDNARANFRQVLNESISQLNSLSRRLGGCVDKARPYYDARKKALEAQLCTQNAAIKFEKACSQLAAAKEMVNLAEQGYFKMGKSFDPAWQEMLNHSTIRVNDAEKERLECEVAHRMTTFIFNEAEQNVRRLQKEYKRSISKSKPYFELKAKYNQMMEDQKKKVERLESSVSKAKDIYSETLRSLETISDEIHRKRGTQRKHRRMKARAKKPDQMYHPLMDVSEVIVEEVSSPSPEEKLITQLDALHHTQKDVDSSQANKTANHSNKETEISKKENSNCEIVVSSENKMPDGTGDATDSPKPLYRSLAKSIEKIPEKSFSEEIQIVTLLASNKMPPSTNIVSADAKTVPSDTTIVPSDTIIVPSDTKIVPAYTKSEPPKFKNLKFLSEKSWNELLSPMKQMSSSETLFHAPLNPVRVENLSTERVDQKLFTRGQTFTVHELMQKAREDKSNALKTKDMNRNEIKARDKVHADKNIMKEDKNYKLIKRSKNRRKPEDSGVQSSSICQEESLTDDQKYLSSPEHDNDLHPLSPDLLEPPPMTFKDASRDSSPEKQDALQQTSYTFLTDRREASLQTSFSLFDRKDELQQTSFQAFHIKKTFQHPRRVSWGKSVDIAINNSDNSRQITGHLDHHHHLELKMKDDQAWKPPPHHSQVVSKTSPSQTSSQFLHGKMEQSQAESETESIASSLNSASLLDDEQVESLMMETGQYHSFLSQMDAQESECFRRLTLPNKLLYLKNLVNFDPVWLDGYDDNDDDEIGNKNEARMCHPSPSDEEKFTREEDGEELGGDDDDGSGGDDDDHDNEYFEECCSMSEYVYSINKSNYNDDIEDQYTDQFDSMLTNLKRVTFDDIEHHHSICDDMESTESDSRTLNCNYRTTPRMANRNKN